MSCACGPRGTSTASRFAVTQTCPQRCTCPAGDPFADLAPVLQRYSLTTSVTSVAICTFGPGRPERPPAENNIHV